MCMEISTAKFLIAGKYLEDHSICLVNLTTSLSPWGYPTYHRGSHALAYQSLTLWNPWNPMEPFDDGMMAHFFSS
jgi:hypothetical protein